MNEKVKKRLHLVIDILDIAFTFVAKFLSQDYLSHSQSGAIIGVGVGLFGFGISK